MTSDVDTFYCPDLVRKFYLAIDTDPINLDLNQFIVHLDRGDLLVTIETIQEVMQVPSPPQHIAPLLLIEYMTLIGARCTEQDRDLWASTTFRNIHCVGCWIQRNILGIDHTTSFNIPTLQIIHCLVTR